MIEKISVFLKKYPKIFIALAYLAASVFVCLPYLKDFSRFILPGDSFFSAWTIGWNLHALATDPANFRICIFSGCRSRFCFCKNIWPPESENI